MKALEARLAAHGSMWGVNNAWRRVQEHDRVLDCVSPEARALLGGRMEALEARLAPGCSVLTWASMNIDGYLHYAHQVGSLSGDPTGRRASIQIGRLWMQKRSCQESS